jgi:hypothetical protein
MQTVHVDMGRAAFRPLLFPIVMPAESSGLKAALPGARGA